MVAGEFAVLEPDYNLVVMAMDRYVEVTIADAAENKLSLIDFGMHNLTWNYFDREIHIDNTDPRLSFVKEAIGVALLYLEERQIDFSPVEISVKSELDDVESGHKYGLGSSAAVVTAMVAAVLAKFLPNDPVEDLVFKLASIAHVSVQGNGSGADIAASTYGGILGYRSFQAEWLLDELKKEASIVELVDRDWKYLSIERVTLPADLRLCVGWTGSPASTGSLVKEIRKLKGQAAYAAFLAGSKAAVEDVLHGMQHNDLARFLKGIEANRVVLAELGLAANVVIETERLLELSEIAKDLGGAGKLSGAGGGDCGIAFVQSEFAADILKRQWELAGIKPLNMVMSLTGTTYTYHN